MKEVDFGRYQYIQVHLNDSMINLHYLLLDKYKKMQIDGRPISSFDYPNYQEIVGKIKRLIEDKIIISASKKSNNFDSYWWTTRTSFSNFILKN